MKKILKISLIVSFVMIAGFGAFLYCMNKSSNNIEEKQKTELNKESGVAQLQGDKLFNSFEPNTEIKELVPYGDNANILTFPCDNANQIYDVGFSSQVNARLIRMQEKKDYTFERPLFAYNPFGTNTCGLYMYFEASDDCVMKYTVTCAEPAIPDYNRTMSEDSVGEGKKHEYVISGLVPGVENFVQTQLCSKDGRVIDTFIYKITLSPSAYANPSSVTCNYGDNNEKISHGITFVSGTGRCSIAGYDNSGILREEIPLIEDNSVGIEVTMTSMYVAPSNKKIAKITQSGMVAGIVDTGIYGMTSDMVSNGMGQILVAAGEDSKSTTGDKIISIDADTGTVEKKADLKKLLKKYYKSYGKSDKPDWLGISGIDFFDCRDIIVSASNADAIIKINNIMSKKPDVDYVIGNTDKWNGSGLEKYILTSGENEEKTAFNEIVKPFGAVTYIVDGVEQAVDETGAKEPVNNYYISCIDSSAGKAEYKRLYVDESARSVIMRNNAGIEFGNSGTLEESGRNYTVVSVTSGIISEIDEEGNVLMTLVPGSCKAKKLSLEGYWYK